MGCIVSSVACCFCGSAASLCCSCIPSCKSSTSSKLMYGLILVIASILSAITLIPQFADTLKKIPALCSAYTVNGIPIINQSGFDCSLITGFGAVYRICFGTTMFFLLMCLLMIHVKSSRDPRAKIQNGFWFFKVLVWIALVIAAFFIPATGFTKAWMIIGMIGGAVYILLQLILLIDFGHSWNGRWVENHEESDSKIYACGLVFFTLLFYTISLAAIICFYIFYAAAPECALHKGIVSVNLILCVILSIVSILPKIHEHFPKSGLLQSSIVTLYVMYLTWSAMTNNSNPQCNPIIQFVQSNVTTTTVPPNATDTTPQIDLHFNYQIFIGLLILICSVIYYALRTCSHSTVGKLTISGIEDTTLADTGSAPSQAETGQTVWDNETEGVAYDYAMYHGMLLLATLYVMVTLTNWYSASNDLRTLTSNVASLWVKIVTSWVCVALYIWTLVAPAIFPDRDFD